MHGIITDRDIVIGCIAAGHDPHTMTAGDLAQGTPFTANADADVDTVLQTMQEHQIRRLPVIENYQLVGMISEADVARHLPDYRLPTSSKPSAPAPRWRTSDQLPAQSSGGEVWAVD